MRKLFVILLVLASVLLIPNFTSASSIASRTTINNTPYSANSSSIGVMTSPSLFPTNATFETKAEVIGNATVASIGGSQGSNYYAQSFKALSDYIINGGLWLEKYSTPTLTPNFRLMLCNNTVSGYPNISEPMALSQNITGATINAKPGRFYLNLTEPIRVQQNQTYWLVIDGYMDNVTNGKAQSRWQYGNPYKDGGFLFSNDAGATWQNFYFATYDLDFIANFTSRPSKAEGFGTVSTFSVGGSSGSDYYAQSFKALDSYIIDAGIWIEKYVEPTPNFRVQIWGNNATGYDHPNSKTVIALSRVIKGSEINATQGQRFFVHPNVSISVMPGEIYWLVIDGYYDQTTAGRAESQGSTQDTYKDGEFLYSNNAGSTWSAFTTKDLNFIVTFSASRSAIKMMKGTSMAENIGGTGPVNYLGQSFKALNKYILDAGVWLENYTNHCPTVRLLLCQSTTGNASQPDVVDFLANSTQITGQEISSTPGMYYLKPTKPIAVVPGQTYFFIIDGWTLDHTTAGSIRTYDRPDNPYKDGAEIYSLNAGASWIFFNNTYDLGVDITFSNVPYTAQCGANSPVSSVGGATGSNYYAQSFVALNDYLADAGLWIEPNTGTTPNFRLVLCSNAANHPNLTDIMAQSLVISGSAISATPGFFYVKPPTPIPVTIGETYWIVIDGYYDHVTNGTARSRCMVNSDVYTDGEFQFSNNAGLSWVTPTTLNDLEFCVTFTHVNQPPTQPPVLVWPLKPFDSDDLYGYVQYGSTDLEQEPIAYYVEWYKNGVLQPAWANINTIPHGVTNTTDNWTVKITPNDGHINGTAGMYTVHVQADILTIDHPLMAYSQLFHVVTRSNTTITAFNFNQTDGKITFTSTGPPGAQGFCNVTIPRTLVIEPWIIKVNGVQIFPVTPNNGTHTFIYLNYSTSSVPIEIQGLVVVPEFTPTMLFATLAISTLAIAVIVKKVPRRKQ